MLIDFRERGRERNVDVREKHWLVASHTHPDRESNPHNLSVCGTMLQPTEPPGQGKNPLKIYSKYISVVEALFLDNM